TSVIDHVAANGTTSQLIKGVVRDEARGVFQGKILVQKGADDTDARMGHHGLIASDRGEIDVKPELIIYADDVQCAHGATVGTLDESALFYMQQRGISADEARALLTHAFLIEVVDRIEHEGAREVFPILSRQVNGKPLVYLDTAASAQKPRAVIDALVASMTGSYANVHRGLHTLSNEATEAYERAREIVARFLNAPSADNIVWTKGGTEAINLVANGVGLSIQPGDEIIVTEMEHHSNIVPWHFLRERRGAVLKWAPIKDDGSLDMEAFAALLGPKTKLVVVTHMSNVLGTINPVAEITRLAHAAGARVLVDGCQGAVHAAPDVQAIGCDYYVLTGHKLFAPTGIGVLYGT
ncbi:hypothetical protein LTR94_027450, partial [Friedmanniomyces endolithicus]